MPTTARQRVTHTRFTARLVAFSFHLRQLASPLHRYADESAGIVDGAIFAFANGTNPEVLLVLEAQAAKDSTLHWHYSLAQMTGGAVTVELDGKEVWQQTEADPPAVRDSYVNGWLSAKPQDK